MNKAITNSLVLIIHVFLVLLIFHSFIQVYIVRQGMDKLEPIFRGFLYEDKKSTGAMSTDR